MALPTADVVLPQIDGLIQEFESFRKQSAHEDCSDVIDDVKAVEMITRARAAIERVGGSSSPYQAHCNEVLAHTAYVQKHLMKLIGILRSMSLDIKAGYLKSLKELIHAELFADFLEMAQHLVNEGYKDAAAVVAGSSLEAHLRQLCEKGGIACETTSGGSVVPKKADRLNSELAAAAMYSKLDQKNVTAWLDLRNKAAHGHYGEYEVQQVNLQIAGIRDFITRNPG